MKNALRVIAVTLLCIALFGGAGSSKAAFPPNKAGAQAAANT